MPSLRGDVLFDGLVRIGQHRRTFGILRYRVHAVVHGRHRMLQLRVRLHHVVAFHEGFHCDLPVGRDLGTIAPFGAQALDVVGFQTVGHRAEAAPDFGAAGYEVDVLVVELPVAEQVLAVNQRAFAIHVPAPAVERTDEPGLGAVAVRLGMRCAHGGAAGDRHAAVAAGIMEGLHAVCRAHDDDRLADVGIFDPVADFGDLFLAAGHLPDVGPEVLDFGLVEFLVVIALGRDPFGIVDRKWDGPQASVSRFKHSRTSFDCESCVDARVYLPGPARQCRSAGRSSRTR